MAARRILLLVSAMSEGGAERVAANLADAWASGGHEVTLVATFSGRGGCHYHLSGRVRLLYLADLAGARGRGPVAYLRRFRALRSLCVREEPDVVVSFLTNVNVAAVACSMGLGVPVVVSERIHPPAYPVGRILSALRRLLYPFASRVVMQAPESLDWLNRRIPGARGVVIPNPVKFPVPSSEPRLVPDTIVHPSRKLLLGVGRLHNQKGFDTLLAAFASIGARHPEWDLAIIGEGPERSSLESFSRALGIAGRVFLPGHLGNMSDWYDRADLYVLSSRFEGFPNSLAEAMAHGRPVVSYDCDTGPRDMIRHGGNGLLVRPVGDPAALAGALDALMSDGEARARLAARASEVRDQLSIASVVARWERIFKEVCEP